MKTRPSFSGLAAPGIALLIAVAALIAVDSTSSPTAGPVPSPAPGPAVHAGGAR